MMSGLRISLCLAAMLFLSYGVFGAELIFFADDSYKVIGAPEISASILSPVLSSGEVETLRISISNCGRVEELIPLPTNSSPEDRELEMAEELMSVDAQDLSARLQGDGTLQASSAPQRLDALASGSAVWLDFPVFVPANASGWHDLALLLNYERQVDVSVTDGVVSPLYQPDNLTIPLQVLVEGSDGPLRIAGIKSTLSPGKRGTILAAIENCGQEMLHNCTLRLEAALPFSDVSGQTSLGDLRPGEIRVAEFTVDVADDASAQVYQLACSVHLGDGEISFPLTVVLEKGSGLSWLYIAAAALVAGGLLLVIVNRSLKSRRPSFKAR
jgi:uncharacterized membrane protein